MIHSIFDSKAEKIIYKRIETYWAKYVDIYPQIPLKSIIGYKDIEEFTQNKRTIGFLQKTSFDFIICKKGSGVPFLVIEFDGIGGGYSNNQKYIPKRDLENDKYRTFKLDKKLEICDWKNLPIVVISYDETALLHESEQQINILDIIIGDAIEKDFLKENHAKFSKEMSEAAENGYFDYDIVIDTLSDMSNPIKRKIKDITDKFPFNWPMQLIFPKETDNEMSGRFELNLGIGQGAIKLLHTDLTIRKVGIFKEDAFWLFNTIGEYCLMRKTEKELGYDSKKWQEAIKNAESKM